MKPTKLTPKIRCISLAGTFRLISIQEPLRTEAMRLFREGEWIEAGRVWRRDLAPGHELPGPAVVLEYSSTTWVPDGWTLTVDEWGNLHLSSK